MDQIARENFLLAQEQNEAESPVRSLKDRWIDVIIASLNMDTAFDIYQYADTLMCDRLKINVIKFFSINAVSLFERVFKSQVDNMPQYLLHEIENFMKSEWKDKYSWEDWSQLDNLPAKVDHFGGFSELPSKEEWEEIYSSLIEIYNKNENVEGNPELLQRCKEVKHWWRKLLKKLRNRKTTDDSGRRESMEEAKQKDEDSDDIFISDEDFDNLSDEVCDIEDDNPEETFEEKYEYYSQFYQSILEFINNFIGEDIYKDFINKRKQSSENPFIFEVHQSQKTRKENKKKANKNKKKKKQSDAGARKLTDLSTGENKPVKIDAKTAKEQKKEMKAKIKELLPKEAPKPTVFLDDEPEYHIVEVNGEYKKVDLRKENQRNKIIENFSEKNKQR